MARWQLLGGEAFDPNHHHWGNQALHNATFELRLNSCTVRRDFEARLNSFVTVCPQQFTVAHVSKGMQRLFLH